MTQLDEVGGLVFVEHVFYGSYELDPDASMVNSLLAFNHFNLNLSLNVITILTYRLIC